MWHDGAPHSGRRWAVGARPGRPAGVAPAGGRVHSTCLGRATPRRGSGGRASNLLCVGVVCVCVCRGVGGAVPLYRRRGREGPPRQAVSHRSAPQPAAPRREGWARWGRRGQSKVLCAAWGARAPEASTAVGWSRGGCDIAKGNGPAHGGNKTCTRAAFQQRSNCVDESFKRHPNGVGRAASCYGGGRVGRGGKRERGQVGCGLSQGGAGVVCSLRRAWGIDTGHSGPLPPPQATAKGGRGRGGGR